jgi:hypothetical protein
MGPREVVRLGFDWLDFELPSRAIRKFARLAFSVFSQRSLELRLPGTAEVSFSEHTG